MPLGDVVRFVADLVQDVGLDHVVIGGMAVSAAAEPRSTKDVDLVLLLAPAGVDSLIEEIERRGLSVSRKKTVLSKLKAGKPAKVQWDRKFSFDLRLASYTIDHHALARATDKHIAKYQVTLRMASPEDLIVYKLARFDDIDRLDIRSIIKNVSSLDWAYIRDQSAILSAEYPEPPILESLSEIEGWK